MPSVLTAGMWSCRQIGMAGGGTVLGVVDGRLLMFDAYAHGERLLLHGNAFTMQHFKGISGAVTDGKNSL